MTTLATNAPSAAALGDPATLRIGLVSVSDRAASGVYQDQGIPALRTWFEAALTSSWEIITRLIPDERMAIEAALIALVDIEKCHLVLTTGGTGPARRDVTPEATLAVATKAMPGFGEQMRQISLRFVPTAILSRQVAVVRETVGHAALILNLPGQPKSIKQTLEGLKDADGKQVVAGIFAAVPYCIDLIGGPYVEADEAICKVFRPQSALRVGPA
ncbi:MAG: molybdopterin adenylyltransferase [Burkholderiaceae bacterium]